VAESPGSAYNPLFIYGGVGLGKTHLLQAIGHVSLDSGLRLLYVSAEQFTNEFINAIREKRTEDFRNKYRSADILLVDDIHFISGKEQTQEGFFHTFNNLHEANRQIVITSDRPPKSMPLLEDRMRSRFEWGLIADIQPPDLETRIAILRAKADEQKATVSQNVLEFIARRVQQNIRELEGSLNRVIAFSQLNQVDITPELAAQALEDIIGQHPTNNMTPQKVIDTVAQYFKLTPEDLKGQKRDQQTALARQITMYLIRQEIHCPLDGVGQELGGRDHSTVIHACEKIAYEVNTNPARRSQVQDIRGQLYPTTSSPS
jgi:chromosomal replication initiator protein